MAVSVVIRNRDEAEHLAVVLAAIDHQHEPCEVIVVDNQSSDDSVGIARAHDARVISLAEFSYGRALNVGIDAASNETVAVLSAHSVPLGPWYLTECERSLLDPTVGGARCIFAGKGADEARWISPERLDAASDVLSRGPLASGCVVRRSVWERVRFDERASAAEDKLWGCQVIEAGWTILSPIPAVYAYIKHRDWRQLELDWQRDHAASRELFGGARQRISLGEVAGQTFRSAAREARRGMMRWRFGRR
jgi:glycosyltransferase involved in cell wall biosynthesis